ncbi:hypothetical protein [Sphingomonas sp. Leaf20]|uniref:hypothetical protein n=1 Tax=Sphingomonas sp. Leaf20 TaxID=1735685 RepID=UPI000A5596D0|nr:hypothetical protein [Sphingomonas sp. Leaf20]
MPADYPSRIKAAFAESDDAIRVATAPSCEDSDISSWQTFRQEAVGTRSPADLTVAYLAGPEPSNDLLALLELGLRPENIWAFEVDTDTIATGLDDLRSLGLRGVKFVPVSIGDYFVGTPRRFDIIYLDACGPLPSKEQKTTKLLVDIFRTSSLSPLGVLVTNFAEPDVSKSHTLETYSSLVAAYLFPKGFVESDGDMIEGPPVYGYSPYDHEPGSEPKGNGVEDDDANWDQGSPSFPEEVRTNFGANYGSFITRQIMDIAEIVAPTTRLVDGGLYKVLFDENLTKAAARGRRFAKFNDDAFREDESGAWQPTDVDMDGDAISDSSMFSLIWTLAWLGFYPTDVNFRAPSSRVKEFARAWKNQLLGSSPSKLPAEDLIACFYAWRHDEALWTPAMKAMKDFPYDQMMPFLCDWPTHEIGFYPAFAQLAYPAHPNIRETTRFSYIAEGKTTRMFLDVIPFDECRYVYDWLSATDLVTEDWFDLSAQLTFRFALDAIVKERRWFGDDFLYGCHVVGESDTFTTAQLSQRVDLSPEISPSTTQVAS